MAENFARKRKKNDQIKAVGHKFWNLLYADYQRATCEKLDVMIGELSENCPKDTLRGIVDVLNKRTK